MPAERVSMRRIREILRLKYEAGASERAIAPSIGVARSTVARPCKAAFPYRGTERLRDSPLEGDGFELPVPRENLRPPLASRHREKRPNASFTSHPRLVPHPSTQTFRHGGVLRAMPTHRPHAPAPSRLVPPPYLGENAVDTAGAGEDYPPVPRLWR